MYLTYEEYQNMGGTLDETTFENYEFQARTKVDWYTFNRLQKESIYPEAVKRCVFSLISFLLNATQAAASPNDGEGEAATAGVASQSNDGVSISYNVLSAKDALDNANSQIETTIQQYLNGVTDSLGRKLLYRGVYADE